jgi:2-dehydropantoate 2-reductase
MAEDVARGRVTEIDAQCGEVVRLARAAGLRAPCNEWMLKRHAQPVTAPTSGKALRAALGI